MDSSASGAAAKPGFALTHSLRRAPVCSVWSPRWARGSNPTQVTAYVVGGVGFLGAGVIISDGVSIRGINTAATLWCAAAAGALAGNGFLWQEGVATAAVLAVNLLLRPLGRRIDRRPLDEDSEVETTYRFTAITTDAGEPHVRALLLQAVAGHGYHLRALRSEDVPESNRSRSGTGGYGRDDEEIETGPGESGSSRRSRPCAGRSTNSGPIDSRALCSVGPSVVRAPTTLQVPKAQRSTAPGSPGTSSSKTKY